MLRLNDKIRLTAQERSAFDAVAGLDNGAPTTVAEHDRRLEDAAKAWEEGESAEERLLGLLARDLKIEGDAADADDAPEP